MSLQLGKDKGGISSFFFGKDPSRFKRTIAIDNAGGHNVEFDEVLSVCSSSILLQCMHLLTDNECNAWNSFSTRAFSRTC